MEMLDRLERVLATKARPAKPIDLDRLRRYAHPHTLPPLFHQLIARRNGGLPYGKYRGLTIRQLCALRASQVRSATGSRLIGKGWWRAWWLPFLRDGSRYLILDLAGGLFSGEPGQIIECEYGKEPIIAFPNIEAFVTTVIALAEKNLLEESGPAVTKLIAKLNPGYPTRGDGHPKSLEERLDDEVKVDNWPEVVKLAEKVAKAKPKLASPWFRRAQALVNLERFDEALEAYDHAFELEPKQWARMLMDKAQLRLKLVDADPKSFPPSAHLAAAERELDAFLATRPEGWERNAAIDAYGNIVTSHESAGDLAEMNRVFTKWKKLFDAHDRLDPARFNSHVYKDYIVHLPRGPSRTNAIDLAVIGALTRVVILRGHKTLNARGKAELAMQEYYATYFLQESGDLDAARAHAKAAARLDRSLAKVFEKEEEFAPLFQKA